MRRRWEGAAVAGLALVVAMSMSLVSFAKEERTKVGTIGLTFASDRQGNQAERWMLRWTVGNAPLKAWIL